jgi:hypothetical protein
MSPFLCDLLIYLWSESGKPHSLVNTETGYRLGNWAVIPGSWDVSVIHPVLTGSGICAILSSTTRAVSPGGERELEYEVDHTTPS